MDKMIKKLMVAGLACVAMCGTAMAAPKGGNPSPQGYAVASTPQGGRASAARQVEQRTPQSAHKAIASVPARNERDERREPQRMAKDDRREPEHARCNAPASRPSEPERCARHHKVDCHDCHHRAWRL